MPEAVRLIKRTPDVNNSGDLSTTDGFALHQSKVGAWLLSVSLQDKPTHDVDYLISTVGLYGVPVHENADKFKADVLEFSHGDSSLVSTSLRKAYIGLVTLSPYLSLFQKGDLLTRVSKSFDEDVVPANGGKIVNKTVSKYVKIVRKVNKRTEGSNSAATEHALGHVGQLASMTQTWLPPMTRRNYYRHAASAIAGENVHSVIKAFGIILAYGEQPSPKEQKREEVRYQARLPILIQRAESRHRKAVDRAFEAGAEYTALRNQQPLTIEEVVKKET